jgi:hypothetical protein
MKVKDHLTSGCPILAKNEYIIGKKVKLSLCFN